MFRLKILLVGVTGWLICSCQQICAAQSTQWPTQTTPKKDSLDRWVNIWWDEKDELIAVQWKGLNEEDRQLKLSTMNGALIQQTMLYTGSTIAYFDTQTLYAGDYWLTMEIACNRYSKKIVIKK